MAGIGVSNLVGQEMSQFAAPPGEVPTNGNGAKPQQGGNRCDGQSFKVMKDNHSSAARRQMIKRLPECVVGQVRHVERHTGLAHGTKQIGAAGSQPPGRTGAVSVAADSEVLDAGGALI